MYFLIFSLFSGIAVHIRFTINLIYKVYTRNKYNKVTKKWVKQNLKKTVAEEAEELIEDGAAALKLEKKEEEETNDKAKG